MAMVLTSTVVPISDVARKIVLNRREKAKTIFIHISSRNAMMKDDKPSKTEFKTNNIQFKLDHIRIKPAVSFHNTSND